MKHERMKAYHKMIVDFWDCFCKHSDPEDSDGWWKEFYEKTKQIYEEHKGADERLARDLGTAFYSAVQRIEMQRRKEADNA